MLEKVIIICSELWRLKRLHFSKHRTGNEEETIDKIAEFIANTHVKQAGMNIDFNDNSQYMFKAIHIKKSHVKKILKTNSSFTKSLNDILDEYFDGI